MVLFHPYFNISCFSFQSGNTISLSMSQFGWKCIFLDMIISEPMKCHHHHFIFGVNFVHLEWVSSFTVGCLSLNHWFHGWCICCVQDWTGTGTLWQIAYQISVLREVVPTFTLQYHGWRYDLNQDNAVSVILNLSLSSDIKIPCSMVSKAALRTVQTPWLRCWP